MNKQINDFSRGFFALLLCSGLVFSGCTEGLLDEGQEPNALEGQVTITSENLTYDSVTLTGHLNVAAADLSFSQVTLYYSDLESFDLNDAQSVSITSFDKDQNFTITLTGLKSDSKYSYCIVVKMNSETICGDILEFTTPHHPYDLAFSSATDLSEEGSANCYIVSKYGLYKFKAVKGNSSESVGDIASVETLWETFSTNYAIKVGDLVRNVQYHNGAICFETPEDFNEGNAVIAAKDAAGTVLWSWHIWLTDEPKCQEYYNNVGIMMDRNLGATDYSPSSVSSLGLLYQWGRKDPFLNMSSNSELEELKSTLGWPSAVESDSSNGTISYAIANPTTFIRENNQNFDWYYSGSDSTDNTRWTESGHAKSIYDPCPPGWRVPDGGENGVWAQALGSGDDFLWQYSASWMNFSEKFGSASGIIYPLSGKLSGYGGILYHVGGIGYYWSASPYGKLVHCLSFDNGKDVLYPCVVGYEILNVFPCDRKSRANALSVRCFKEFSVGL